MPVIRDLSGLDEAGGCEEGRKSCSNANQSRPLIYETRLLRFVLIIRD